jgi:hypothetical protein
MLRLASAAILCALLASVATCAIRNESEIELPEIKNYGYPLAWVVTDLIEPTEYLLVNFVMHVALWTCISLVVIVFLQMIVFPGLRISIDSKSLLLPALLFVPFGLLMDLVHECGHAMLGMLTGGTLTYMKIAYLEIYPRIAITTQFQLGLTRVDGLAYGSFEHGLMLLGGSLTTNIVSWILGAVLATASLSLKARTALKVLGVFGILDLPFYIVFPQIGLGHWIFIGGQHGPEPLIGARMMGMPDLMLYLLTALSTFGLVLLYSEAVRQKLSNKLTKLLYVRSGRGENKESRRSHIRCAIVYLQLIGVVEEAG